MNIFISGSTTGIGRSILLNLLKIKKNCRVYCVSKNRLKESIRKEIKKSNYLKFVYINANFLSLSSVKKAANKLKKKKIDIIINNAGTHISKSRNKKIHEMILVNSLSHYFINKKILDNTNKKIRIINISSITQFLIKKDHLNEIDLNPINKKPYFIYALSKFLLDAFLNFLLSNYKVKHSIIYLNPGMVKSNFGFNNDDFKRNLLSIIRNLISKSPDVVGKIIVEYIFIKKTDKLKLIENKLIKSRVTKKKIENLLKNLL